MLKKLVLAGLGVLMMVNLTGCDETAVAFGAGAVGGALATGAVYNDYYGRNYYGNRGYYGDDCYWNRYDGYWYRRNCGGSWYSRNWWNSAAPMVANQDVQPAAALDIEASMAKAPKAMQKYYGMSETAAYALVDTFNHLKQTGKFDSLANIGMTQNDILWMARGYAPSSETIGRVAYKLQTSRESLTKFMGEMTYEMTLQKQYNYNVKRD